MLNNWGAYHEITISDAEREAEKKEAASTKKAAATEEASSEQNIEL